MAFSVAEDELRAMDTQFLVGHLAAWNYYQSLPSASNKKFVKEFKAFCKKNNLPGGDKRVTDDPIEAAYISVNMWALAAANAKSFEVDKVRPAVYGMKFKAPGTEVMCDE
jgi:urea transport system substrate-binding protein